MTNNLQKDFRLQRVAAALRNETGARGVVILVVRRDSPIEMVCLGETDFGADDVGKLLTQLGGQVAGAMTAETPGQHQTDAQGKLHL